MIMTARRWSLSAVQLSKSLVGTQYSTTTTAANTERAFVARTADTRNVPNLKNVFPDFLPVGKLWLRHPLREKLERQDMLRRREQIEIPEFYVGSIVAVTASDRFAPRRTNRFLGICILRENEGLRYAFVLRNVIDGLGVEVKYDLYNPLVQKIEIIKLEKRLDDNLLYLRDALPEYSTFPFDMEAIPHVPGTPITINPLKVKMRPKPWHQNWEIKDMQGIDSFEHLLRPTDKLRRKKAVYESWKKYDLMEQYRKEIPRDDQVGIYDEMVQHHNDYVKRSGQLRRLVFSPSPASSPAPRSDARVTNQVKSAT